MRALAWVIVLIVLAYCLAPRSVLARLHPGAPQYRTIVLLPEPPATFDERFYFEDCDRLCKV